MLLCVVPVCGDASSQAVEEAVRQRNRESPEIQGDTSVPETLYHTYRENLRLDKRTQGGHHENLPPWQSGHLPLPSHSPLPTSSGHDVSPSFGELIFLHYMHFWYLLMKKCWAPSYCPKILYAGTEGKKRSLFSEATELNDINLELSIAMLLLLRQLLRRSHLEQERRTPIRRERSKTKE